MIKLVRLGAQGAEQFDLLRSWPTVQMLGLTFAVSWLEPFYKKYNKNADLSYGDLYTLAGVVAIETLAVQKLLGRLGEKIPSTRRMSLRMVAFLTLIKEVLLQLQKVYEISFIVWVLMIKKS